MVEIDGKKLMVSSSNFDDGSMIVSVGTTDFNNYGDSDFMEMMITKDGKIDYFTLPVGKDDYQRMYKIKPSHYGRMKTQNETNESAGGDFIRTDGDGKYAESFGAEGQPIYERKYRQIVVDDKLKNKLQMLESIIKSLNEAIQGGRFDVVETEALRRAVSEVYSARDILMGGYWEAESFGAYRSSYKPKKLKRVRQNSAFPSGTSLQGYIKTNPTELRKAFGKPNMGASDDGKVKSSSWNLIIDGKVCTIYDRRERGKTGMKYFNIGGRDMFSPLLVAQELSKKRGEKVKAHETVPKWNEEKRFHERVNSIGEHPIITYDRAMRYYNNQSRYRAESFGAENEDFETIYLLYDTEEWGWMASWYVLGTESFLKAQVFESYYYTFIDGSDKEMPDYENMSIETIVRQMNTFDEEGHLRNGAKLLKLDFGEYGYGWAGASGLGDDLIEGKKWDGSGKGIEHATQKAKYVQGLIRGDYDAESFGAELLDYPHPMSDRQKYRIRKLGGRIDKSMSRSQASQYIKSLMRIDPLHAETHALDCSACQGWGWNEDLNMVCDADGCIGGWIVPKKPSLLERGLELGAGVGMGMAGVAILFGVLGGAVGFAAEELKKRRD